MLGSRHDHRHGQSDDRQSTIATGNPTIATIDPTTGRTLRTFTPHGADEVAARLARAATAFEHHRRTGFAERASSMRRAADLFDERREALAGLAVQEMGKTIRAARSEVEKCALGCRWYAEHGAALLADEPVADAPTPSFVAHLPLGPILAIMPWNFPFWQVLRFAAPALVAGNVALLKHASNVPQCALAFEELFARAGFAAGVFQTLLIGADAVADVIARPARRRGDADRQRGRRRGARDRRRPASQEGRARARRQRSVRRHAERRRRGRGDDGGHGAYHQQRPVVHRGEALHRARRGVRRASSRRSWKACGSLRVGDPGREDTDLGPLATEAGRVGLVRQVEAAVGAGARVLLGGHALPGPGWFYGATVLADLPATAPVHHEEVFGPVALVYRVRDVDAAITLANDTPYGLASSVWTNDAGERERFVRELAAGMTFVNAMVASDPRLPFGGIKRSGYGRELGALGIREFTNQKTIVTGRS